MKDVQPQVIYLSDYKAPLFLIEKTRLNFEIQEEFVVVTSLLDIYRNPEREAEAGNELELNGDELELLSVKIDGVQLSAAAYKTTDDKLIIEGMPERCVLSIETKIFPQLNTALEGLYKSSGMYCTQCEAEGFRRITYFLDRPDVMSTYEVTITADKGKYPVLLSNGNLIDSQNLDDGRHLTTWHDPHKKPCYLFALVAGDLQHIEDNFVTASGEGVAVVETSNSAETMANSSSESVSASQSSETEATDEPKAPTVVEFSAQSEQTVELNTDSQVVTSESTLPEDIITLPEENDIVTIGLETEVTIDTVDLELPPEDLILPSIESVPSNSESDSTSVAESGQVSGDTAKESDGSIGIATPTESDVLKTAIDKFPTTDI